MSFAFVGLLLASAAPAGAASAWTIAGAGAGAGFEYPPNHIAACSTSLPPNVLLGDSYGSDQFVLTDPASNFDAVNPSGETVASYAGPVTMTINLGAVVQAPQGAQPGGCTGQPVVPAPVTITSVSISGMTAAVPSPQPPVPGVPAGNITCGSLHATTNVGPEGPNPFPLVTVPPFYLRANTTVVFDFVVDCTMTGNVLPGSVTTTPVHFHVVGNQIPCLQSIVLDDGCNPPLDPNAGSVMQTQFVADGNVPAVGSI